MICGVDFSSLECLRGIDAPGVESQSQNSRTQNVRSSNKSRKRKLITPQDKRFQRDKIVLVWRDSYDVAVRSQSDTVTLVHPIQQRVPGGRLTFHKLIGPWGAKTNQIAARKFKQFRNCVFPMPKRPVDGCVCKSR